MTRIEVDGYQRLRQATAATLSVTVSDGSKAMDPGVTTVTVTRADGTALKSAETATNGTGTAPRTLDLTATDTADLDLLTCIWETANSGTLTTYAEIVGNRLFTLSEARTFQRAKYPNLTDSQQIDDDELDEARSWVEDEFANICGVSFIPRYAYEVYDNPGLGSQILRHTDVQAIRSIEYRVLGNLTWVALDSAQLASVIVTREGAIVSETGLPLWFPARQLRIGYEYGRTQVPFQIKRAALQLLADASTPSNLPDRALSLSDEMGTFRLATAGVRGSWFGLPKVDSVLARFQNRSRGFA